MFLKSTHGRRIAFSARGSRGQMDKEIQSYWFIPSQRFPCKVCSQNLVTPMLQIEWRLLEWCLAEFETAMKRLYRRLSGIQHKSKSLTLNGCITRYDSADHAPLLSIEQSNFDRAIDLLNSHLQKRVLYKCFQLESHHMKIWMSWEWSDIPD